MGAFTNRYDASSESTALARTPAQRDASAVLARYEPPNPLPEISIGEGEESYTDYVPVKRERSAIGRLLFGEPEPTLMPVRKVGRAVERSNDKATIAANEFRYRDQVRDEERKMEEHIIGKGKRTVELLHVERDIRHAEFEIELELEQQESDRQTFSTKREIDRLTTESNKVRAEMAHVDALTQLERRRQIFYREQGATAKLQTRFGGVSNPFSASTGEPEHEERITTDEIDALAHRATLAAITGSVNPSSRDRWGYPFAGNIFLTHFMDTKDLSAAKEHTQEAMFDLFTQAKQGRFHLTKEKAEREYAHYQELYAQAEQGGVLGALKDLMASMTRKGGKHAFDDLNA
jgi:hypothetical protein